MPKNATTRAYGGKHAHQRASANGETQLAYEDWLTVRTPAFKAWFGDWEAVRGTQILHATPPLNLDALLPLSDKKAVESAFRNFGPVKNQKDGRTVTFPVSMAGKIARHKGFDSKRIAGAFAQLFAHALPMFSETEELRPGHKVHIQSIEAYHHYVNLFEQAGLAYYVRFTVQQMQAGRKQRKGTIGPSFVHSSFISTVLVYKKSASDPLPVGGWDNPVLAEDVALDRKLAEWLSAGKSENLRYTPTLETGEPSQHSIRRYEAWTV